MFRKPSDVRGKQRLSGADRKKLRRNIRDKFPGTTDEQLEAILPAKADVAVTRLTNRVLVYGLENGLPMLFDCNCRGNEIYPTVFALWRVPDLLPSFLLTGEDVSRNLLSGADLMAPGVEVPVEGLPAFQPGEVWSVKVPGNSCPIAVGITMLGSEEVSQAGMRGKLLRITHFYRDSLWESARGSYVPNKGFLPDMVASDPDAQPTLFDAAPAVAPEDSPEGSPEDDSGAAAACGGESEGEECTPAAAPSALTPAQMDELLDLCLLQALSVSVKPSQSLSSPLTCPSQLAPSGKLSNHVLPCRPPGTTVDIKKSSHKKLSKWLHVKAVDGLICGKEDKHRREFIISAINHPWHVPACTIHPSPLHPSTPLTDMRQGGQAPQGVHHLVYQPPMACSRLYHPPLPVAPIYPPHRYAARRTSTAGSSSSRLSTTMTDNDTCLRLFLLSRTAGQVLLVREGEANWAEGVHRGINQSEEGGG
ncbi:unnamed protein product [Closterium sp. Naga37s-1]|nr:unnamed protein product [Closterium sp. Naga37s-1]